MRRSGSLARKCLAASCMHEAAEPAIDESLQKRYTIFRRCSSAAGCRGVAQLVARLLWEQEAASSSLATPTIRKATMNRSQMRFCRGFICCQSPEIRPEDALFVRYRLKNHPCAKGQMRTRQLSDFVLFLFTNSTLTPKYPFCNLKEYSECK